MGGKVGVGGCEGFGDARFEGGTREVGSGGGGGDVEAALGWGLDAECAERYGGVWGVEEGNLALVGSGMLLERNGRTGVPFRLEDFLEGGFAVLGDVVHDVLK